MIKKIIALLFLASLAKAESVIVGGEWRGLNNNDASVLINDNEAQDLIDIDVTETKAGIKKRKGYSQFKTIGTSTWGVRGGYYFRDIDGDDTVVHANHRSVFKSVDGAAYSAFITTDTVGSYYDFTDSQGYLWRVTSNNDEVARYDGSSTVYYPAIPKGDQIEATPSRFVISGSTSAKNRLYFSADGDPTTYTTGILEASAFTEDIGLPGQAVRAIKYACDGVLVWTKDSLSLVTAKNQFDLSPTVGISNTIGTVYPESVIVDYGIVYWQGQDKEFYSFDCNQITRISRKIDTSSIVGFGGNVDIVVDTEADFEDGSGDHTDSGLSSEESPGNLTYIAEVSQDTDDGYGYRIGGPLDNSVAQSFNPSYNFILSGADYYGYGYTSTITTFTIRTDNSGVPSSTILATATVNAFSATSTKYYLSFSPSVSLTAGTTYWLYALSVGAGTDVYWLANSGNPYSGGNAWSSAAGTASTIDMRFEAYTSSAVYQSESFSHNAGITFGLFSANHVLNSGTITYAVYTDSNGSFDYSDPATFTSSETITSGSVISLTPSSYVAWTAVFTRTDASNVPTINDVTISYSIGAETHHFASVDKDHRIIWSVAEGAVTAANKSYIYDPLSDIWLKYSFPMDAPARVGDSLYFGGVSTGVVYNWPSGDTDAGSAITAYWKSKDFIGNDPFVEKDIFSYSILSKAQTGSNIDTTLITNTASSASSNFSLTADVSGSSYRRINGKFASGKYGTLFNFKIGNDDGDAPFEIYSFKLDFTKRPWRVLP